MPEQNAIDVWTGISITLRVLIELEERQGGSERKPGLSPFEAVN